MGHFGWHGGTGLQGLYNSKKFTCWKLVLTYCIGKSGMTPPERVTLPMYLSLDIPHILVNGDWSCNYQPQRWDWYQVNVARFFVYSLASLCRLTIHDRSHPSFSSSPRSNSYLQHNVDSGHFFGSLNKNKKSAFLTPAVVKRKGFLSAFVFFIYHDRMVKSSIYSPLTVPTAPPVCCTHHSFAEKRSKHPAASPWLWLLLIQLLRFREHGLRWLNASFLTGKISPTATQTLSNHHR